MVSFVRRRRGGDREVCPGQLLVKLFASIESSQTRGCKHLLRNKYFYRVLALRQTKEPTLRKRNKMQIEDVCSTFNRKKIAQVLSNLKTIFGKIKEFNCQRNCWQTWDGGQMLTGRVWWKPVEQVNGLSRERQQRKNEHCQKPFKTDNDSNVRWRKISEKKWALRLAFRQKKFAA